MNVAIRCCYRIIMMPWCCIRVSACFCSLRRNAKNHQFYVTVGVIVSVTRLYAYTDRGRRHTTSNLVFLFLALCTRDIHSVRFRIRIPLISILHTVCVAQQIAEQKRVPKWLYHPDGVWMRFSRIAAFSHSWLFDELARAFSCTTDSVITQCSGCAKLFEF